MKKIIVFLLFLAFVQVFAGSNVKLSIGDKAVLTGLKMKDISGKYISLDDMKKQNGIVLIFSANACPFVLMWEKRYPDLKQWADKNDVGMMIVNSNHQNRSAIDSYSAMQAHAKEKGYNFPYVLDEDSRIANSLGGQTTPHAFLFNKNFELVYKGVIDDNYKNAAEVKIHYLKDAISSLGRGEKIKISETNPIGCSIKRKLY